MIQLVRVPVGVGWVKYQLPLSSSLGLEQKEAKYTELIFKNYTFVSIKYF